MNELYKNQPNIQSRWVSFENPLGEKGKAGMENRGAKGHPCEPLRPKEKKILTDVKGCGIITRIWMTLDRRSPKALRSIRLDMYWDGAKKPAVSVPLGDFFGMGLSHAAKFENELFSSPEGRSFNCFIPMPFKKEAKVILTNESDSEIFSLFYDIDYVLTKKHGKDSLYFHASWRRENRTKLAQDFTILPQVKGGGRFLGCVIGVMTNPVYETTWFGEGEVKIYLDGDKKYPTLCGTGTEDYIGSAWGQDVFINRFQGCTISQKEKGNYAFYRFHIPDPVFFQKDCRVTIQSLGGAFKKQVLKFVKKGYPVKPVTISTGIEMGYVKILEKNPMPSLNSPSLPKDENSWVNFYRCDDYSATAYFYLDKPENNLPFLSGIHERINAMPDTEE